MGAHEASPRSQAAHPEGRLGLGHEPQLSSTGGVSSVRGRSPAPPAFSLNPACPDDRGRPPLLNVRSLRIAVTSARYLLYSNTSMSAWITGYHGLAKLTNKAGHYRPSSSISFPKNNKVILHTTGYNCSVYDRKHVNPFPTKGCKTFGWCSLFCFKLMFINTSYVKW